MGGRGSGTWYRWSKKPKIDELRPFNINALAKAGYLKEGCYRSGGWEWSRNGEKIASIGFYADTTDKDNPHIRLKYTVTKHDGEEIPIDYKVKLAKTYPNYGGVRYWFICPHRGRRVAKLYIGAGSNYFISRHAYRLKYASQSESYADRMINKKWRLHDKLGGGRYYLKPKGMHQTKYQRLLDEYWRAEMQCEKLLYQMMLKFKI